MKQHSVVKILCIFLFTLTFSLYAQSPRIDSLKNLVTQKDGKERLALYVELVNALEDQYPLQAITYAKEAMPLAMQRHDTVVLIELTNSMSFSYSVLGEFEQALRNSFYALELAKQINDKRLIASSNSTIGIAYVYVGQYSKALKHHLTALKLREELGLTDRIIRTLNNIGVVYFNIGQYQKAIDYYKEAMQRRMKMPNPVPTIRFMDNIGLAYTKLGNFEEAKKYHFTSLRLADSLHYYGGLPYTYINLGILFIEKKEYHTAIDYLKKSLAKYDSLEQRHGVTQVHNALGRAYFYLGNYSEAKKYLEQAAHSAIQSNAPEQLKTAYEYLYEIYDKKGDNLSAYKYFKLFSATKDTLNSRNEANEIADLTIKLEILDKEREIEKLKNENQISLLSTEKEKLKFRLIIIVVGLLIVIASVLYVAYRKAEKHSAIIEQKNSELNALNKELSDRISEIKVLSGLIPICSNCKKVRDDKGYWEQVEGYIAKHSDARFSHGICPDCIDKLYPEYAQALKKEKSLLKDSTNN